MLAVHMQASGIRCWFAPEDLKIGDRFRDRIEESIHVYDKVVIVLSEQSVQSPWVRREVEAALDREDHEHRDVLFPIRLDDAVMNANHAWAAEVRRSRQIGDFKRWKEPEGYRKAFARLLRHLKTTKPDTAEE